MQRYLSSFHIRLFLTAWVLYALHFSTNIVREHYPAFSLVKNGTFRVDEYHDLHPDIFVHTDGHAYIGNNVATSVLASIPLLAFDPALNALEKHSQRQLETGHGPQGDYRVDKPLRQRFYQQVTERGLALRFGASAAVTSVFLVALLSSLCVVGVFQILLDRGVTQSRALWLAIVFAFGTPLFFRSAHLTNNVFVMYFAFAAFWLLWRVPKGAAAPGLLRRALAGLCAGMTLACDYSGVVPLVCLTAYAILAPRSSVSWKQALGDAVPFVLASTLPVGFLLYSQWAMYGNPFLPGQYWMPDVNYTEQGWRGFSFPSIRTFLLNLFHPSYGMYLFGPILLLGLIPAWRYPAEGLIFPRRERLFTACLVAFFLLFCAANQYSLMQFNTGFRYLLPLVPFIFLAACDHLARLPRAALFAVTVGVILHTWVLCMARDCNPNDDTFRLAPSLGAWLAEFSRETVPASYLRIWNEGLQLPWLRVMTLTAPQGHPIWSLSWLPTAVLAAGGIAILAIWRINPHTVSPETLMTPTPVSAPLPTVAVVVPVLNEAHVLEKSIGTLLAYLREDFPYPAQIIIADNGSTDGTREVARDLEKRYEDVSLSCLPVRGRGRALRTAWTESKADIVAYMDVDLSTELPALEKLCRAIHEQGYDLATGSRLMRESRTTRCFKREVLSRGYNLLIKCVLWTRFSDAQCGFKAVSREVVERVIPLIENNHWFFDTELLVLGEKLGYRIKDVPVEWIEDPDSRVKIVSTVWEDIKGVFRLRKLLWSGRLRGFVKGARKEASEVVETPPAPVGLDYVPASK